ncbi:hypothetical protein BC943DRAFT_154413 [Umbelopsis sp. AD052]|nr:hypothetical protein BC943DRAFT_154413 [Umbelopsis sp. AD052]
MPYKGRKRQKTIAHGGKQVRVEETQSQHPDSEEDTSSSSVENPEIEDHSSTENEEEDDRAASSEAPEQHLSLPLVTRMDDQAGLSSTAKQRPLKRFDITPLFSAKFSKFQQRKANSHSAILLDQRQDIITFFFLVYDRTRIRIAEDPENSTAADETTSTIIKRCTGEARTVRGAKKFTQTAGSRHYIAYYWTEGRS